MTQFREFEGVTPAHMTGQAWASLLILALAVTLAWGLVLLAGYGLVLGGQAALLWLGEALVNLIGGVYAP